MNAKLEFVVKLPQGVIDAMHLNEETCLCSWIEAGELHVRVEDDPPEYGDAFDDGFDEGFDALFLQVIMNEKSTALSACTSPPESFPPRIRHRDQGGSDLRTCGG